MKTKKKISKYPKPSEKKSLKDGQKRYNKKARILTIRFLAKEKNLYLYAKNKENTSEYIKGLIKEERDANRY